MNDRKIKTKLQNLAKNWNIFFILHIKLGHNHIFFQIKTNICRLENISNVFYQSYLQQAFSQICGCR